ncbi:MAG TPA: hypothetical protein VMW25_04745 [Clostridia bacterium]|nr:hypothetical protein [Clostridia bacterium]
MRAKNQEITLTLDMAWNLCLKQWAWIKAEKEAGSKLSAITLKGQWCRENGFDGVHGYCFFCEYNKQFRGSWCDKCPGRLVDPKFGCNNKEYHYGKKPLDFHAELVRLNKIRLGLKEEPYAC